jgi:RHH-type proline utilization regulon transcriptional repressor/proline dehydrogenase/delta 1-pyrroline-5-carboxylate dehydrogenase
MANEHRLASLSCALLATAHNHWKAAPMLGCASSTEAPAPVLNPSDLRDVVGHVQEATVEDVDNAIQCALNAARSGRPPRPPSAPRSWNAPPT